MVSTAASSSTARINSPRPAGNWRWPPSAGGPQYLGRWQINREGVPSPLRFAPDEPAVALDDSKDRRQSEAGPLPISLVVKNGSKIYREFPRDSGAGIADADDNVGAGLGFGRSLVRVSFHNEIFGRKGNNPPSGMASRALTPKLTMTW